jgi:hypothetical protein
MDGMTARYCGITNSDVSATWETTEGRRVGWGGEDEAGFQDILGYLFSLFLHSLF